MAAQQAKDEAHAIDGLDPDEALTLREVRFLLHVSGELQANGDALDLLARIRGKLRAALKARQALHLVDADQLVGELALKASLEEEAPVEEPAAAPA